MDLRVYDQHLDSVSLLIMKIYLAASRSLMPRKAR